MAFLLLYDMLAMMRVFTGGDRQTIQGSARVQQS
jgi:hypothetical protein